MMWAGMDYVNGTIEDDSSMVFNSDKSGRKAKRVRKGSSIPIDLTLDDNHSGKHPKLSDPINVESDPLATSNISSSRRRLSSSRTQLHTWVPSTYITQSPLELPKPLEGDNALMNYMHHIVKKVPFFQECSQ
jgi:hypothetical protein